MRANTWMTFNGQDFDNIFVVERVTRSLSAGINNSYIKEYHLKTEIAPTSIRVKIRLIEESDLALTELKRYVAGKLYSDKPEKLILYDDPTRYDIAKLDGMPDFEKLWTTGSTELNFINYSGISYSSELKSPNISTDTSLSIGGTRKTKPKITVLFSGVAASYKVTNMTTGKHVEITGQNFVAGNVLVVDCEKQVATLNGNPIMPKVTLLSDFFALQPGINLINSTKPGTIEYQEAWL